MCVGCVCVSSSHQEFRWGGSRKANRVGSYKIAKIMSLPADINLESILPGGWTAFRTITPREANIFKDVLGPGMMAGNVKYIPLKVSTQFIFNANYRFECRAQVSGDNGNEPWVAILEFFRTEHGEMTLVAIQPWI